MSSPLPHGADIYIDTGYYKRGNKGFIFTWNNIEWVKSTMTASAFDRHKKVYLERLKESIKDKKRKDALMRKRLRQAMKDYEERQNEDV